MIPLFGLAAFSGVANYRSMLPPSTQDNGADAVHGFLILRRWRIRLPFGFIRANCSLGGTWRMLFE
jgi:hypothetical protein